MLWVQLPSVLPGTDKNVFYVYGGNAKAAQAAATQADPRWAAVAARSAAADGSFWYSVQTTGVYCRPSCAARAPRPENVRFHDSCADAEAAGFRPCQRCKPRHPTAISHHSALVTEACRIIEGAAAGEAPTLDALAAQMGLSPSHLHRIFKQSTGLTPKAYAAAQRAQRLRSALDNAHTASVTDAIYSAGYQSSSRFYEQSAQVLGMTPSRYRAGGAAQDIRFAIGQCSLGAILVAQSDRGICAILLGDDADTLAARVLAVEHPLMVKVLQLAAAGRLAERNGQATLDGQALFTPLSLESMAT